MDFYNIKTRRLMNGAIEIYPDFKICRSKDLMIRGRAFYAIWDESNNIWSTDEYDVQRLVDDELYQYKELMESKYEGTYVVKTLGDFSTGSWTQFRMYITHISDCYKQLDDDITFEGDEINRTSYRSKKVPYKIVDIETPSYTELSTTIYTPDELAKIEWAIGAILTGNAKKIQKFIVLYGEAGTGKSTIINIVQKLFTGYYTTFEAKALTSTSNAFSTDVFKSNPLVAIQHDGDLSKIEDNTKLNSIISHEEMSLNEKYKPSYTSKINCFLFLGTNKPVKITDAKSGIIRRLIDVRPSGKLVEINRYQKLIKNIDFELGGIAHHCIEVYKKMGKNYYNNYKPLDMIFKTDVFYNYVENYYDQFVEQDGISLAQAYELYKNYCDESLVDFKLARYKFREELKNYFEVFEEITRIDGKQIRSYYSKFKKDKFENLPSSANILTDMDFIFKEEISILDDIYKNCKAQYAVDNRPQYKWINTKTKLSEIDTSKTHYVQIPDNYIVIDFDLKNEKGEKDLQINIEAAKKWPKTYAEISNGGNGIHLHYYYTGDIDKLKREYSDNIEIKCFNGNAALRRRVSKVINNKIAKITGGLPTTERSKMLNINTHLSERKIRDLIKKNLRKEIHPGTKPSIDFIYKILEDAYHDKVHYDVNDLYATILNFAMSSSNQSDYCVKMVNKMRFKSDEPSEAIVNSDAEIMLFDIECFKNLFLIVFKPYKSNKKVCLINPKPHEIEYFLRTNLVGFNNRGYDNHMLYAAYLGYNNMELYNLSQRIIDGDQNAKFMEAYNISYTDVYDFASAPNKKSLKKWQIILGIHHKELGMDWNEPVPEHLWPLVQEYCENDVESLEVVFDHLYGDWAARQILAELSGLTVNHTTNQHSIRIVFGTNKNPQNQFNYPNLSELFPGYKYEYGKATYRGVAVSNGGQIHAEPGMYGDVLLADIESMHPTSAELMELFGPYTQRYSDLKAAKNALKHNARDILEKLMDGKLLPIIDAAIARGVPMKAISTAIKTVVNAAYGLTFATFDNPFKDPRNKENIVAKRGALFMIDLMFAVKEQGYKVIHIKTDSIKIPDHDEYISNFIIEFAKKYGYTFELEAVYNKLLLVNDAVYVAQKQDMTWTHTGAQFAHPYVFKKLFSKEEISFHDMCESKSSTSIIYMDKNENLPDVTQYERELALRVKPEEIDKNGNVKKRKLDETLNHLTNEELIEIIKTGHDYQFVGKVGSFTPVAEGNNGGILYRYKDGKFYSVTGTSGYRWLESEVMESNNMTSIEYIDMSYFNELTKKAVQAVENYGDYKWFSSNEIYNKEQNGIYPF